MRYLTVLLVAYVVIGIGTIYYEKYSFWCNVCEIANQFDKLQKENLHPEPQQERT